MSGPHLGAARRWVVTPPHAEGRSLAAALGLPEVLGQVLARRGVLEVEEGKRWLGAQLKDLPDPLGLTGMAQARDRLIAAIDQRETICIHGDYDVDGMTSTALLHEFLRDVGADCRWFAPHRKRDGYGVQAATMRRLAAEGVRVVITCDNGVSAHEAIECGNACGIATVVVDHHTVPPTLPAAAAILNPKIDPPGNPYEELAAVGVAFLLALAIRGALRARGDFANRPEPDLREALDLVALGTVADLAPLRGVNRLLVTAGQRVVERRKRPGIAALLAVAGHGEKPTDAATLGFQLGPRLNAAGRMADASMGVELLLETDRARAEALARELDQMNRQRQDVERGITSEAMEQASQLAEIPERGGLVLWDHRWHAGVVGIVAARVTQALHRPALVLAVDEGAGLATGSGRGIHGVDLFSALGRCAPLLLRWGGHRAAAGLTVERGRLEALRELFAGPAFEGVDDELWAPILRIDAELPLASVDWTLWEHLRRLHPFGVGNPEPLFVARGLRATGVRAVAKGGLKLTFRAGDGPSFDAIGFGLPPDAGEIRGPIDAAFHVDENHWNGRRSLQLRVRDLRASDTA